MIGLQIAMQRTPVTKLRAPFAWIGGKSKLADDIVAMMPEHRLYVEVFGGALNVLYRKPVPTGRHSYNFV